MQDVGIDSDETDHALPKTADQIKALGQFCTRWAVARIDALIAPYDSLRCIGPVEHKDFSLGNLLTQNCYHASLTVAVRPRISHRIPLTRRVQRTSEVIRMIEVCDFARGAASQVETIDFNSYDLKGHWRYHLAIPLGAIAPSNRYQITRTLGGLHHHWVQV